jgi:AraC family transcriptional regulator
MSDGSDTLMKSSWARVAPPPYGTETDLVHQIGPTLARGRNCVGDQSTSCSAQNNTSLASNFLGRQHNSVSSEPLRHPTFSVPHVRSVMTELFAALRSAFSDERGTPEERLRRASAILQAVEEPRLHAHGHVPGGLAPWQVRKVTSFIETNLDSPIRSANLASMVRLTPCHFSRAFRNSLGHSPIEYVIRRRIERAQALMLSTDTTLSQIALDCGFVDQAYLCRLFRRIVGESPGTWRRVRVNPRS